MTTIYVNPDATYNGDGTLHTDAAGAGQAGAYNAIPSISANNTYLFKEGTTYTLSGIITIFQVNSVTLGTYNSSNGADSGWTSRAVIDSSGIDAARTIRIEGNNNTVKALEVIGCSRTGVQGTNIIDIVATSTFTTVDNCKLYNGNEGVDAFTSGIKSSAGWPLTLTNNEVYDVLIGIQIQTTATPSSVLSEIKNNNIHDLDGPSAQWGDGDCIFASSGGGIIDHDYKIVISENTVSDYLENAIDTAKFSKVIIEENTIGAPNAITDSWTTILLGTSGGGTQSSILRNNFFLNITHPTVQGIIVTPRGASYCYIYGNIFDNCTNAPIFGGFVATYEVDNRFYNNTIIANDSAGADYCIRQDGASNKLFVYNNIFSELTSSGVVDVILANNSATIEYGNNCYETSYGISDSSSAGTLIDNGNDIVQDPELDSNYALLSSSPCIGEGIKWWGTDPRPAGADGEPFSDLDTDIGGIQSTYSSGHPENL